MAEPATKPGSAGVRGVGAEEGVHGSHCHAAHLHGGVGVDRYYPLHRFFLLTEQIELTLGGANESLRRLGLILASEPV